MKDIKFTPDMVGPLRKRMNMTQESFAYIVGCGARAISNYENNETKNKPTKKINRAVRDNMIRLMRSNKITALDLTKEAS